MKTEPAHPDTLFFDTYKGLNKGKALTEASEALAKCSAKALEHGKKATLTIKLTISPLKEHEGAVEIIDDIATNIPKSRRKPRLMFSTPEGILTTEQPDQDEFSFERDASIISGPHTPPADEAASQDQSPSSAAAGA